MMVNNAEIVQCESQAKMEYCIAGKFGGLVVYITTAKLKSAKISYSHYTWIRMAIQI